MHFNKKERIKRIQETKDLMAKDYTKSDIAKHFGVSEETVQGYLDEFLKHDVILEKEKEVPVLTLGNFTQKTVDPDEYFKSEEVEREGFRCPLCKSYVKFESSIDYSKKVKICRHCWRILDRDKIDFLNSLE